MEPNPIVANTHLANTTNVTNSPLMTKNINYFYAIQCTNPNSPPVIYYGYTSAINTTLSIYKSLSDSAIVFYVSFESSSICILNDFISEYNSVHHVYSKLHPLASIDHLDDTASTCPPSQVIVFYKILDMFAQYCHNTGLCKLSVKLLKMDYIANESLICTSTHQHETLESIFANLIKRNTIISKLPMNTSLLAATQMRPIPYCSSIGLSSQPILTPSRSPSTSSTQLHSLSSSSSSLDIITSEVNQAVKLQEPYTTSSLKSKLQTITDLTTTIDTTNEIKDYFLPITKLAMTNDNNCDRLSHYNDLTTLCLFYSKKLKHLDELDHCLSDLATTTICDIHKLEAVTASQHPIILQDIKATNAAINKIRTTKEKLSITTSMQSSSNTIQVNALSYLITQLTTDLQATTTHHQDTANTTITTIKQIGQLYQDYYKIKALQEQLATLASEIVTCKVTITELCQSLMTKMTDTLASVPIETDAFSDVTPRFDC